MSDNCVFCKIIAGQAPGQILHRDTQSISFLDIAPVNPGHTLVVPLRHHKDMFSMNGEDVAAVARHCHYLAPHIKAVCEAEGIGIHQLNGRAAGQTVFHYHMHIIPACSGSVPRIHGRRVASAEALQAMADRIRRHLRQHSPR